MIKSNINIYSENDLICFKNTQNLAYETVQKVRKMLKSGMTEKAAASLIYELLDEKGVKSYFHKPFAWFGDRSRFRNINNPFDFFPTNRKLEEGMAVILDVAPILNNYAADIGYSFSFGENPDVKKMQIDLLEYRKIILEDVLAEKTFYFIAKKIDNIIREMGYENCHKYYPFGVLAHKVEKINLNNINSNIYFGFGLGAVIDLFKPFVLNGFKKSPFCHNDIKADFKGEPGLWAFEPHIGINESGAKWEEILVINNSTAYWLDNELPHLKIENKEFQKLK